MEPKLPHSFCLQCHAGSSLIAAYSVRVSGFCSGFHHSGGTVPVAVQCQPHFIQSQSPLGASLCPASVTSFSFRFLSPRAYLRTSAQSEIVPALFTCFHALDSLRICLTMSTPDAQVRTSPLKRGKNNEAMKPTDMSTYTRTQANPIQIMPVNMSITDTMFTNL